MNRSHPRPLLLCLLAVWQLAGIRALAQTTNAHPFAAEIAAFAASDKTNPPPLGANLFVGSSSIRKWTTLARDFPGHTVINRGFGGSQISDSIAYADRIVLPYKPKTIIFFAGSNDLDLGKTADRVFDDFKTFAEKVHAALPETRLGYISITTSPLRWREVEEVKKANRLISGYIARHDYLTFIDVFPAMLTPEGKPKPGIYVEDGLHLNARGYAIWTAIIEPYLK
jgi:lysophospholipase L1-like esterase